MMGLSDIRKQRRTREKEILEAAKKSYQEKTDLCSSYLIKRIEYRQEPTIPCGIACLFFMKFLAKVLK